ncbi:hypothetical protein HK104_010702 [Borealophlyctis nickersoniae]|nr:hypothetical protein HK104_010702 [Borealophlyctis nickersoniae]
MITQHAYAHLFALSLLVFHTHALTYPVDSAGNPQPGAIETYYMDPVNLWENRNIWRSGRKELNPAINRVIRLASGASNDMATYTVTSKPSTFLPPSNDPHDYYSLARYYWPNNSTANGLPYMRVDGSVNPEIYQLPDATYLQIVFADVWSCGLAYFFTGNETYAATAVKRIRDWFLNDTTRMNPNMNYASWVKGMPAVGPNGENATALNAGGLLDMSKVYQFFDGVQLIRSSPSFLQSDYDGLYTWFRTYLTWLQTSPRGAAEARSVNNQGQWYDVQVTSILLFLNQPSLAASVLQTQTIPRIPSEILPDGSMPLEQTRPTSWFYSNFALAGFFVQGHLAASTNVSVFGYQTSDGRSLLRALNYLVPFALGNGTGWPVPNQGGFGNVTTGEMCKEAFVVYRDQKFLTAASQLQNGTPMTWNPTRLWSPYNVFDVPLRSGARRSQDGTWIVPLGMVALWFAMMNS